MRKIILQFFTIIILLSLVSCGEENADYYEIEYAPTWSEYSEEDESEYAEYTEQEVTELPNHTNSPDRTFVEEINNADQAMIARLEMWQTEETVVGGHYEAVITILSSCGELIQEISDIVVFPILRPIFPIIFDDENPLNFHFADYNADGFLDMGLRWIQGGSMQNDPHYFWLWNVETEQFIRNHELEEWSKEASVWEDANSWLSDAGNIHSRTRIAPGHYFWSTRAFIDGELTTIQTLEHMPVFDCDDYHSMIITTNRITGEETTEFISWEYEP